MINKKYKIQKNTVQETLIIPLYNRKCAMDMYPHLFYDNECQSLFEYIDYDFKPQGRFKNKMGAIMAATRQYDMSCICKQYLKEHPKACVVNIGCGLDTTFRQIDNGTAKGYNIDFYDVIQIRNELLSQKEREINIACDIMDFSWFDKIDYKEEDGIVFFASGVFYYFKKDDIKALFLAISKHFSKGKIAFDTTNQKGLKNMAKTWLEPSKMKNINVYFCVDDETELYTFSQNFKKVVRKGYMAGYRPLDKSFGLILNCLFQIIDRIKWCQIIEITFCDS